MNLLKEKQWIKEEIDNVNDELIIVAVKNNIDFAKKKVNTLTPLTVEDLIRRAKESELDIKENRVVDLEELEKDSQDW
jgi:hypothetical protein